jgi:hypothetical protein
MKKLFVLILALSFVAASATTMSAIKPAYTDPTNAYWQIIDDGGDNVLACVIDADTGYGLGDDCRIYNTDTMDFTGVETALYMEFDVSLVNESANDHCLLQMRDSDDSNWTTIEDFTADTVGYEHRQYDLIGGAWGDWTVNDSVYVRFRWESDAVGTDDGIRINDFTIYTPGETIWEQYLYWTSDHSPSGPGETVNLDISDSADGYGAVYVNFHFTDGGLWAWWCLVDQVEVGEARSRQILEEDFESWPPDDFGEEWTITELGTPDYVWKSTSMTGRTNYAGYSGYAAYADSDYHYPGGINSELISPAMDCSDASGVYLYFIGAYNWIGSGEYFEVLVGYETDPIDHLSDDFEGDLSQWTVRDLSGNMNIKPSSLGTIKGMYH